MHSGRAAELGARGGRRRARQRIHLEQLPAPTSASAVKDLLGRCVVELRAGALDVRLANALFYGAGPLLRAIEIADVERRLSALEKQHLDRSAMGGRVI